MMQPRPSGDHAVLGKIARSASGVSAIDIAIASLGERARRHSKASLSQIGLSIAIRLIGEGYIEATRTNTFRVVRKDAA